MYKQLGILVLCALPALAGCTYFAGESDDVDVSALPPGHLSSECARLQPLFLPGAKELSREEFEIGLKNEMNKWDKDGNGTLSHTEAEPLNDALRAENVGASPVTDWNGDGAIDMKEFASGWRTMFDLCDRNGNSKISYSELGRSPNVTGARPSAPAAAKPEGTSQPQHGGY